MAVEYIDSGPLTMGHWIMGRKCRWKPVSTVGVPMKDREMEKER